MRRVAAPLAARLRDERGVALVLAVVSMAVLASLTAAVLASVTVNHRNAYRSAQSARAFSLAEAGLAYAEGRLFDAVKHGEPPNVPLTTLQLDGGTVTYSGTLAADVWTLTGTGTINGVTRVASSHVDVPPPQTISDPTIWNYLYADSSTACVPFGGNVRINVPLYTHGSLCMNGNATFTGSDLEVGGSITLTGNAAIGKSTAPISTLNVVGSCSPGPCDGRSAPIWVSQNPPGFGHTLTPQLTMPTIDLPGTYASTNPGPATGHACQAGSGVPTPFFDGNTTLDNSLSSVNLFPASSYDCRVGSNRLAWNPGTKTLTIAGTFFFDGSLSLAANTVVNYVGKGVLYFTGTIDLAGNSKVCGVTDCSGTWDPGVNQLILVAGCWGNSTGSTLVRRATSGSYCVDLAGNNIFQAGTYLTTDYHASGNAANQGPVIADTLTMDGNVSQMIPFTTVPDGAPTSTTTVPGAWQPARDWNG